MLNLFKSLFTSAPAETGAYPEHIVQLAIERAVEATDKRIGLLPNYQRQLRPAVLKAIDQVVGLVAGLPEPVTLSQAEYAADGRLRAFFSSPQRIGHMLAEDPRFGDFRDSREGRIADRAIALLILEHSERKVLGMDLQGDAVRREVAQRVVSFSGHRLLDSAPDPESHLKLLRRRAYDHLLERALGVMASERSTRADLERELGLLRRKLDTLEAGDWGFEPGEVPTESIDPQALEGRILDIERELSELGGDADKLTHHLGQLTEVLSHAEDYLRLEELSLTLDPMGVVANPDTPGANELHLQEIHAREGRRAIVLPVEIPRGEWPERRDFLDQAQRFLG